MERTEQELVRIEKVKELRNKGMGNLAPFLRFLAHYLIVSRQTQIIGYRWSNILAPFPALTAQQLKAGPGCGQG